MSASFAEALLIATPSLPLVLAFVVWIWPDTSRVGPLAAVAALPALAASGLLSDGASVSLPWLLAGSELGLNTEGRLFLLSSSLLWAAATVYAGVTVAGSTRDRAALLGFFLLSMSGNFGLVIARDMLIFYLCFTLMSMAAYGMIVHTQTASARAAGRIYITLVIGADLALYAALAIIALATSGELTFDSARAALADAQMRDLAVALIVLGFGVKVGLIGLHVSLPLIYAAAPPAAAAALAGPVLNAALLGWLRLLPLGAEGFEGWGSVLVTLGVAATFLGALYGVTQRRAATVLAYSSVSQMGLMTFALGFALHVPEAASAVVAAVALYAMHHAFTKGALFLGADLASRAPMHGSWRRIVAIGLVLLALTLAGAPLTSGMVAKEQLKEVLSLGMDGALATLLPWTAVATMLLGARYLVVTWAESNGRLDRAPRLARAVWIAALGAALVALWLVPPVHPITVAGVWSTTWPILIAVGLALVATRTLRSPDLPPGDIVVPALAGLQRVQYVWEGAVQTWLPALRARMQRAAHGVVRDPRWTILLERAEHRLIAWPVACSLFVALILVLGAALRFA